MKSSCAEILGFFLEQLAVADDRVQRRAQLVRHVGQELRLVPAGSSSWRLLSSISRNSRAFWMASADWLAKVCSSVHRLRRELARRAARTTVSPPSTCSSRSSGTASSARMPGAQDQVAQRALVGALGPHVGDLDRRPPRRRQPDRRPRPAGCGVARSAATSSSSSRWVARSSNAPARLVVLVDRRRRRCPRAATAWVTMVVEHPLEVQAWS